MSQSTDKMVQDLVGQAFEEMHGAKEFIPGVSAVPVT